LGYCPVIKILKAKIQEDLKNNAKTENGLVLAISRMADKVLHIPVDAEDPDRLDHQVDQQQKNNIADEKFSQDLLDLSE
jgi:hypothetical protein